MTSSSWLAIDKSPSADRRRFMTVAAIAGVMGSLGGIAGRKSRLSPITPAQAETEKPTDYRVFDLESVPLQSGTVFRNVKLAYKTYGQLAPDKSNVIVCPSAYGSTHKDVDSLTSPGKVLDPSRYFIIAVNMLGNGLSSSPSNAVSPFDGNRYPRITLTDNVRMQQRLVAEVFGIQKIALVYGWSMGGQQAYHWGALFPDMVERICVVCGSARTSVNNLVFLAGVQAALTADPLWQDGWFAAPPLRGLKAFARVYAGWVLSPAFYRQEMYKTLGRRFPTLEDFLVGSRKLSGGSRMRTICLPNSGRFRCKSAAPACVCPMRRKTFRPGALRSRLQAQFGLEGRDVVARTAPCGCGASARCRRS
jgi:pimeloyl-ACP methyl ester carboxylesterase